MACTVRNNLHRVRFLALLPRLETEQDAVMKKCLSAHSRKISMVCGLLLFLDAPRLLVGEPTTATVSAFNSYSKAVESRLAQQHRSPNVFLALVASYPEGAETRLRQGQLIIEQLTPSTGTDFSGAMLHHWRGTAFAPRAKAADFERLMRDFNSYPQHFSPQVIQAKVFTQGGYDITFGQLDVQHGYSISQSTRIAEINSPGTSTERTLNANEEHGFLWRLNTYWSYEERDGGLYLQIEAVSLTRSIPSGLGWAIRPYVESIPRESLEFTLRSACNALRK